MTMRDYEPRRPAGRVEDYTVPFLWMAGVVVFMGLIALWAANGYLAALVSAGFLRWAIELLPKRE